MTNIYTSYEYAYMIVCVLGNALTESLDSSLLFIFFRYRLKDMCEKTTKMEGCLGVLCCHRRKIRKFLYQKNVQNIL